MNPLADIGNDEQLENANLESARPRINPILIGSIRSTSTSSTIIISSEC